MLVFVLYCHLTHRAQAIQVITRPTRSRAEDRGLVGCGWR